MKGDGTGWDGLPAGRRALEKRARALRAGPWCWPEGDEAASALADRLGLAGPGPLEPGQVPLVTASAAGGALWALNPGSAEGHGFGPRAERAWASAGYALSRAIPVAWQSVRAATDARPRAAYLGQVVAEGRVERVDALLEGPSFGLAFVLALASRVTGRALPDDWAASATVDEEGRVGPVDGLAEKACAIVGLAPRIRRFLVAESQRGEAQACFGDAGVQVVGVRSASQALAAVVPDLASWMLDLDDPDRRSERVEALFRLALGSRAALVDWAPVGRAAARLRQGWTELSADQVAKLRFAEDVADRHAGLRRPAPPPADVLKVLPQPQRTQAVAHWVQSVADAGGAALAEVQALVHAHAPQELDDCFPAQLELRGAWARLQAVLGAPRRACAEQLALVRAWIGRGECAAATFGMSEAFRLAGALRDEDAWGEAEEALARAETLGDLDQHGGRAYVEVARARGQCLLGRADLAKDALEQLWRRPELPDHLRLVAARWCVAAARASTTPTEAPRREAALARLAPRHPHLVGRARALLALDDALARHDREAAARAIEALGAIEAQPLGQMRGAWHAGVWPDPLEYVARFYPY